jgi:hypothetical protein
VKDEINYTRRYGGAQQQWAMMTSILSIATMPIAAMGYADVINVRRYYEI